MKARKTELTPYDPENPNHFTIKLSRGREIQCELPFPLDATEWLKYLADSGLDKLDKEKDGMKAMGSLDKLYLVGAAGVGLCWRDPEMELQTEFMTAESMEAYAKSIMRELHGAGWSYPDYNSCATALMKYVVSSMNGVTPEAITAQADFSEARRDGQT